MSDSKSNVHPVIENVLAGFKQIKVGADPEDVKTGQDVTETTRRAEVERINSDPGSRVALEAKYGAVYDTDELQDNFDVENFLAPYVIVTRKSDGVRGTLTFQHRPRFYYDFQADKGK